MTRFSDSLQQRLTLASLHQIGSLQLLVKTMKLPLIFPLTRVKRVEVSLTVGQGQLLLDDRRFKVDVVSVFRDGQSEVGEIVDQVLDTLVVSMGVSLSQLLN